MTSSNKTSRGKGKSVAIVVRLISDQRQMLAHAGCDKEIIEGFDDLLRFLRTAHLDELNRVFSNLDRETTRSPEQLDLSDETIETMPVVDLVQIIGDETVPRRTLERIAILRFRVPRGSMRSFSNRTTLIEKLWTLVRNEQAHATIEAVAQGQGAPETRADEPGTSPEKKG